MSVDTVNSQKRSGTVLFADVVGFTSFAEKIGEEMAFEMIQDVTAKMQAAIHAQEGTIGEFRGDGIMALFSVTEGLEDGPLRACQAALDIQKVIAGTQADMTRAYGAAPQVRVGVHCGPLVVGDVGHRNKAHVTIIGDTANVASRLEGLAEPGQVLITRDLFLLVEGQVSVQDLGPHEVRGKAQPVRIYALTEVRHRVSRFEASRSRGLSRLVDRDLELAQLEDVFQRTLAGQITLAGIQGEPGIGKSRLVHEFQQTLPEDKVRVLKGDCRADGTTVPFLPFADILRTALNLEAQSTAAETETAVDALIARLQLEPDTTRSYLMALLGKSGEGAPMRGESADMIGARIRQVIIDLILNASRERPWS
ncbi:adenylate/guanylate cyclase domain-containing protein [Sulfitobacter porphyrae]|uniref:Adenylate/guanylate cyclase domain-containing protein n=1 Tax=Sulfitobacter porphyrae TaxID=1246864 RepID=A0ABW2B6D5_9RHOB